MKINDLNEKILFEKYLESDINNREINIFNIKDVQITGDNLFYPNCLIYSNDKLINPINELVMSLKNLNSEIDFKFASIEASKNIYDPVFFFIYNTDNYYHFIYDTLPYLISYRHLKSKINNLKLLMNFPNYESKSFYPFVLEFLEILDIKEDDILLVDDKNIYSDIYISSSYTHDINSELPPRKEIYDLYEEIVKIVNSKSTNNIVYPKKIYISRRTWLHNNFSNIGTNYTTKRKMVNEDELVNILIKNGYTEVFTENLSTIEKIEMFSNAENVIGAIGGGLCNVLFSNENTELIAIISPTFLDVNNRFLYSFSNVKTKLFKDTSHTEHGYWKKYMRVKSNTGIIGEIEDIIDNKLLIMYTDKKIAGWNSQLKLDSILIENDICERLDAGLNSPWMVNIEEIVNFLI